MTNQEFVNILELEKVFTSNFTIPQINTKGTKELVDTSKNKYVFDYQLGSAGKFYIELSLKAAKQKWQLRNNSIPLVRIDINGAPHMCPDTGKVEKNHIHIYFPDGTKAYEISQYDDNLYKNLNPYDILNDFFKHVHIQYSMGSVQEAL